MPKKLKIKIDGVVSTGDIPDDVEELEIECGKIADSAFQENGSLKKLTLTNVEKVGEYAFYKCKKLNTIILDNVTTVGKRAFDHCHKLTAAHLDCKTIGRSALAHCKALNSVTLLNTEIIGKWAFGCCKSLNEIGLPDTLRVLGDNAFMLTGILHLAIPPSVVVIGSIILDKDKDNTAKFIIEMYLKNGTLPFKPDTFIAPQGTLIIIRSPETNEILYQYVLFGSGGNVLGKHGIDFTKYDEEFKDPGFSYGLDDFEMTFQAARVRLHNPAGMSAETYAFYKDYVSEKTMLAVSEMIGSGKYTASGIAEYPYLDDIDNKRFLSLIDHSVHHGTTEITEMLIQIMLKRIGNIGNSEFMELIDYSAQQGTTELTAVLMQKLHERGIGLEL